MQKGYAARQFLFFSVFPKKKCCNLTLFQDKPLKAHRFLIFLQLRWEYIVGGSGSNLSLLSLLSLPLSLQCSTFFIQKYEQIPHGTLAKIVSSDLDRAFCGGVYFKGFSDDWEIQELEKRCIWVFLWMFQNFGAAVLNNQGEPGNSLHKISLGRNKAPTFWYEFKDWKKRTNFDFGWFHDGPYGQIFWLQKLV